MAERRVFLEAALRGVYPRLGFGRLMLDCLFLDNSLTI